MRDFSLDQIERIAGQLDYTQPLGQPLIDNRLAEYEELYKGRHPYYKFFFVLASFLEPEFVVELGGWQGTAAACFAAGSPDSHILTIDHHTDPGDDENKKRMQEAVAHYPNLTYLQGWTWDVLETVRATNKPINILFIDSWHQYKYAMRDWSFYSPLLANNSLVICDDLLDGDGPVISGMKKFWDDLPALDEYRWKEDELHRGIPMGFIKHVR